MYILISFSFFLTFNSSKFYRSLFYYSKRNTWRTQPKLRIISLNIRHIILNFPFTLSHLGQMSSFSVFFVWREQSKCLMSWAVVSYDERNVQKLMSFFSAMERIKSERRRKSVCIGIYINYFSFRSIRSSSPETSWDVTWELAQFWAVRCGITRTKKCSFEGNTEKYY